MGKTGAPEEIRTPDPQIRRLTDPSESKQESCKPGDPEAIADQYVTAPIANQNPADGAQKETAGSAATEPSGNVNNTPEPYHEVRDSSTQRAQYQAYVDEIKAYGRERAEACYLVETSRPEAAVAEHIAHAVFVIDDITATVEQGLAGNGYPDSLVDRIADIARKGFVDRLVHLRLTASDGGVA